MFLARGYGRATGLGEASASFRRTLFAEIALCAWQSLTMLSLWAKAAEYSHFACFTAISIGHTQKGWKQREH